MGHSIGATMLLALAGGQVSMRSGQGLTIARDRRIERLALMAPATGFFLTPGALDAVQAPILAWAGTEDRITPPADVQYLERALADRGGVEVRVVDGAGHLSFMDVPPPDVAEPLRDRETFLSGLAAETVRFVCGSA